MGSHAEETPGVFAEARLEELSHGELERYSRHLILPEIGQQGQKKLKAAKVLIVGTGALSSPAAMYLAAAGVGALGLVDDDIVEESNLQRQIIHAVSTLGRLKTESARDRILDINPYVAVSTYNVRLTAANALDLFSGFDVIVDGSDNFPTRYLINDACVLLGKPLVYGAVYRFEGYATVFDARRGGCMRCLFPHPPDPRFVTNCGEGGVLGTLPGIVGSIQANEVVKLIVGGGRPLIDRLVRLDAWEMRFHQLTLAKDPSCPLCGEAPSITGLIDYEAFCGIRTREESCRVPTISARALKTRMDHGELFDIIDIRLPHELTMGCLPGALSIPLAKLIRDVNVLDPAKETILVCKKGESSEVAAIELLEQGYKGRLLHLSGGMNAWAREVDPSIPIY